MRNSVPAAAVGALTAVASVAATLLVVEIGLRVFGVQGYYPEERKAALITTDGLRPLGTRVDTGVLGYRMTYPDDPRGYFGPGRSVDHLYNSAGWRDVEHGLQKGPGTYRILGLGDSYLFGEGVRREDTYFARLAPMLQSAAPAGVTVEMINMGFPGFNTVQELAVLEEAGLAYRPDLVVVTFVLNDIEENVFRRREGDMDFSFMDVWLRPDALSRHSYLWGFARQRYLRTVRSRRYIEGMLRSYRDERSKWEFARDALAGIRRSCAARDIDMVVVIFPFLHRLDADHPFRFIHEQVRGFCAGAGIPALDLLDVFRGFDGPELWVHTVDQHPNETAHQLAAQAISSFLVDNREQLRLFVPR